MLANLNGWHAVLILAVVLLLFGAPKIPMLAKSLGQSMKIFKHEIKPDAKADSEAPVVSSVVADPIAQPAAVPLTHP